MLVFTLLLGACTENPGGDIKTTTFKMLTDIRSTKKNDVLSELKKLLEKSNKALKDKVLIKTFFNLRKNAGKQFEGDLVPHYEFKIDKAYVKKYYDFYDILFIDVSGYIFYTVRRESDYRDNIFYGRIANTKLAKSLMAKPGIKFVDYDYYSPSKEAAAFFVTLVKENVKNIGWIIFQYSMNSIN